jgi:hypothetical protein
MKKMKIQNFKKYAFGLALVLVFVVAPSLSSLFTMQAQDWRWGQNRRNDGRNGRWERERDRRERGRNDRSFEAFRGASPIRRSVRKRKASGVLSARSCGTKSTPLLPHFRIGRPRLINISSLFFAAPGALF